MWAALNPWPCDVDLRSLDSKRNNAFGVFGQIIADSRAPPLRWPPTSLMRNKINRAVTTDLSLRARDDVLPRAACVMRHADRIATCDATRPGPRTLVRTVPASHPDRRPGRRVCVRHAPLRGAPSRGALGALQSATSTRAQSPIHTTHTHTNCLGIIITGRAPPCTAPSLFAEATLTQRAHRNHCNTTTQLNRRSLH